MSKTKGKGSLKSNLETLSEITNWFDEQDEVDVEKGLEKVKKAAELIKVSKKRLREIENEFEEIKRDIEQELEDNSEPSSGEVSNELKET